MQLGAFSISLAVNDIEASRDFYQKFGFEIFGGGVGPNRANGVRTEARVVAITRHRTGGDRNKPIIQRPAVTRRVVSDLQRPGTIGVFTVEIGQ